VLATYDGDNDDDDDDDKSNCSENSRHDSMNDRNFIPFPQILSAVYTSSLFRMDSADSYQYPFFGDISVRCFFQFFLLFYFILVFHVVW